jgi:hypothetical protein
LAPGCRNLLDRNSVFTFQMSARYFVLLSFFLVSAACTPEATPFPVDAPTPVSGSSSSDQSIIRYALAPNTSDLVSDIALIEKSAQIEQLDAAIDPADLGNRFDIVVTYGDIPGGTRSPITPHIALVINPSVLPWSDLNILSIFRHSLDTAKITQAIDIMGIIAESATSEPSSEIRSQLANAGWPDGLSFNFGIAYAPGGEQIINQWQTAGIDAQQTIMPENEIQGDLIKGRLQAGLIIWTTPDEREIWVKQFGKENVIDLYSLPISYLSIPELHVTFTSDGWPLPTR